MEKEIIKKGFDEAQNSLKEKQVAEVKSIVLETLKKISYLRKNKKEKQVEIKELEDQIKILEADVDDLKVGRIDRLVERQEKDELARKVSVVVIIKEKEIIREPYYQPYIIEKWNPPIYPNLAIVTYNTTSSYNTITTNASNTLTTSIEPVPINCSIAKFATMGAYSVEGVIVNLR